MPQPDKYSIIAVSNSVLEFEAEVNEVGTRVVNNDKYTLQRIEEFLNESENCFTQLESEGSAKRISRNKRIDAALADFDLVFGELGSKI